MAIFDSNFEAILSLIGAGSTLQATLVAGNTTGGNPIEFTNGDFIQGQDNSGANAFDMSMRGGNVIAGVGDGGDLLLFAGTGLGGGSDGIINITGDTTFNNNVSILGTLSTALSFSGALSPEGVQVAPPGATYHRTTPTSLGNAYYIKLTGVGNTGWAPMGPRVSEAFLATGASATFTLTSSDSFYRNIAGTPVIDVCVYWNGVRLTFGAATGDFAVTAVNAIEIRDGAGLPLVPLAGDRITIDYLPL